MLNSICIVVYLLFHFLHANFGNSIYIDTYSALYTMFHCPSRCQSVGDGSDSVSIMRFHFIIFTVLAICHRPCPASTFGFGSFLKQCHARGANSTPPTVLHCVQTSGEESPGSCSWKQSIYAYFFRFGTGLVISIDSVSTVCTISVVWLTAVCFVVNFSQFRSVSGWRVYGTEGFSPWLFALSVHRIVLRLYKWPYTSIIYIYKYINVCIYVDRGDFLYAYINFCERHVTYIYMPLIGVDTVRQRF